MTVSRDDLVSGLHNVGVGDHLDEVIMAHVRMSEIGWVIGGAQTVLEAILKATGPTGTLMMLTGW